MAKHSTSLYLDDDLVATHAAEARLHGVSLSEHVNTILAESARKTWPAGFWDTFGSLSTLEEPDELSFDDDSSRQGWL